MEYGGSEAVDLPAVEMPEIGAVNANPPELPNDEWKLPEMSPEEYYEQDNTLLSYVGGETFDLVPGVIDDYLGVAGGMASGAVFGVLAEELTPIVGALIENEWWRPGYKLQEEIRQEMEEVVGRFRSEALSIQTVYDRTPTYVWFRDNGRAGQSNVDGMKAKTGENRKMVWGYGDVSDLDFQTKLSKTGIFPNPLGDKISPHVRPPPLYSTANFGVQVHISTGIYTFS